MIAMLTMLLGMTAHAADRTHDIRPEDLFSLDSVSGLAVNRTGSKVVYVRNRWEDGASKRGQDLWVLDTRARTSRRLTVTEEREWAPTIDATDTWVYFKAKAGDEGAQVFRIHLDGTAQQQVTHADGGVDHYDLVDEGLWFTTSDTQHVEDLWDPTRDRFPDLTYPGGKVSTSTVHRVDLETWRVETVLEPGRWIMELAVAPDEARLAMLTAPDDALITHEGGSEVTVYERATDTMTDLPDTLWRDDAPSPYGWLLGLDWSSDSRALAFRVDFDGYPGESFVAEFAGGEAQILQLPRPREITPEGGDIAWVPGKRDLCYRAWDHARIRLQCATSVRNGAVRGARTFPEGNVVVGRYAFSQDGRDIVAVAATPDKFAEIYRLPARGRLLPVQLTSLNPHVDTWKLPSLSLVSWEAPDGTTVEGLLELPAGYSEADGPIPMVVQLHGGPTSATPYARRFRAYGQTAFAAKGWALFSPNYRGSTGYGDTFLTQLVGHENDIEVADILAGVDAMVSRGIADPERLAVMGWSNGGYLTNALITHTDRFKAASSGAGVVDMTIQWALEDTPGHVVNYLEGLPWEQPEEMIAASPLYDLDKVSTPTLIHVGENDPRVPAAHARALYRGLSFYRKIPSELVIYPGAGHGLRSREHLTAKLTWDHAWFGHYVLEATEAPSEHAAPTSTSPEPAAE